MVFAIKWKREHQQFVFHDLIVFISYVNIKMNCVPISNTSRRSTTWNDCLKSCPNSENWTLYVRGYPKRNWTRKHTDKYSVYCVAYTGYLKMYSVMEPSPTYPKMSFFNSTINWFLSSISPFIIFNYFSYIFEIYSTLLEFFQIG